MRVAIVHDWLTGMRGGEVVLEALIGLHPQAEIFTLLHVPGSVSELIEDRPIHTSFVQRIPGAAERYRYLLPLFPRAVESLEIRGYDLVLSSSHCVAKGARAADGAPHLCYCHTPMRYVWDQFDAYFGDGRAPRAVSGVMSAVAPRLRAWDRRTSSRVDRFVANSRHVAHRIRRYLGRDAEVVHPPVDIDRFSPAPDRGDYYVVLGAPAPYKRVDLAVEACRALGRPLRIVGEGTDRGPGLPSTRADDADIRLLGRVSRDEVARTLSRARALILPGVEDFGIGVVEALASGTPVIAQGRGGVLDTVRPLAARTTPVREPVGRQPGETPANDPTAAAGGDGPPTEAPADPPATGVFFDEPTAVALADAIVRFEAAAFDPKALVESARPFAPQRFAAAMRRIEEELMSGEGRRAGGPS